MVGDLNPRHLMTAQEIVASTLSGNDVSVVFDADTPWADIKARVIHLRPVPDQISGEAIEDIRGDCDHELGHIIHTSTEPFENISRQLVKLIANSIEDGRVERLISESWIGCGENLERSTDRAVKRIALSASSDETNIRSRAVCGLSLISYGRSVDSVIAALGSDVRHYYEQIRTILNSLPSCNSSQESVDCAVAIADTWNWHPVASGSGNRSHACSENRAAAELDTSSLSAALERKSVIRAIDKCQAPNTYRAKTAHDRVEVIRRPSFDVGGLYKTFFDGVQKTAPELRRRLLMEFKSAGRRFQRFQRRGEVDERSLHRVALNDLNVYRRKVISNKNRSTVSILVDCSASMTRAARAPLYEAEPLAFRTKLFVAAQAAAAVSLTLDILGIPNEVLAFTTSRQHVSASADFDRVRPIRHLIVKPLNKPFRSCRGNFLFLAFFEHCSENVDGEAVLWSAKRLLGKPNCGDRPTLFVFSDGSPASYPESASVLANHLKESLSRVERAGVSVFGVGVGSDAVKDFYSKSIVVHDVTDLPETLYRLIRKVLKSSVDGEV